MLIAFAPIGARAQRNFFAVGMVYIVYGACGFGAAWVTGHSGVQLHTTMFMVGYVTWLLAIVVAVVLMVYRSPRAVAELYAAFRGHETKCPSGSRHDAVTKSAVGALFATLGVAGILFSGWQLVTDTLVPAVMIVVGVVSLAGLYGFVPMVRGLLEIRRWDEQRTMARQLSRPPVLTDSTERK